VSQKIAVVGAEGFIGSRVVSHLIGRGLNVSIFTRSRQLLLDPNDTETRNSEITDILWLASDLTPIAAEKFPELVEQEFQNFKNLLRNLEEFLPNVNLIYPSSGGTIYSQSTCPTSESQPVLGFNSYGQFKLRIEEELRNSRISFTVLRIANVYGPNQPTGRGQGVIAEWMQSFINGVGPNVFGDLSNSRDFVHIDDVARAFERALAYQNLNCPINIGSGESVRLDEILGQLRALSRKNLDYLVYPSRGIDRPTTLLDISRASELINWKPQIRVEDGIRDWWEKLQS